MGKDCGSWLHHQLSPWQSPNLNYMNMLSDTNPSSFMVSPNGSYPGLVSERAHLNAGQGNQENGWFNCAYLAHHQAFTPNPNTIHKEKLSALGNGFGGEVTPNTENGSVHKRLLIFDQSRNETNLIFSSAIGTPIQHLNLGNPTPFYSCGSSHEEGSVTKRDGIYKAGAIISNGLDENREIDDGNEMHEDTEELNALLYSDDGSDYDDEETSTGHSPSEITVYKKREEVEESATKVGSSVTPTKRKRPPLDEDDDNTSSSLMDTATSTKPNGTCQYEDDAESSYVKGRTHEEEEYSMSASKRLKRERIQETMRILQSVIPGGEDKDAVFVLEEAIRYLRSLKLKVKSLGLDLE